LFGVTRGCSKLSCGKTCVKLLCRVIGAWYSCLHNDKIISPVFLSAKTTHPSTIFCPIFNLFFLLGNFPQVFTNCYSITRNAPLEGGYKLQYITTGFLSLKDVTTSLQNVNLIHTTLIPLMAKHIYTRTLQGLRTEPFIVLLTIYSMIGLKITRYVLLVSFAIPGAVRMKNSTSIKYVDRRTRVLADPGTALNP
jgi:hypothetical protein